MAFEVKVWIERDLLGNCYVMRHLKDELISEVHQFATIHYHPLFFDNASICQEAVKLAVSVGGTEPIEIRTRDAQGVLESVSV